MFEDILGEEFYEGDENPIEFIFEDDIFTQKEDVKESLEKYIDRKLKDMRKVKKIRRGDYKKKEKKKAGFI